MADREEEKRRGDPDPADFDKVDVEDVAFFRKVARGLAWLVGLQDGVVG